MEAEIFYSKKVKEGDFRILNTGKNTDRVYAKLSRDFPESKAAKQELLYSSTSEFKNH